MNDGGGGGEVTAAPAAVVGREEELAAARRVLAGAGGIVVFRGEAGIGKTTLWEAAVATSGRRVLAARPVEAERRLALATLADLLEPVADEVLPELPAPQRRALEAALLLAQASRAAADPRALGAALVGSLRVAGNAVLAVDDLQWADAASRASIAFALRRLSSVGAAAVLAVRGDALPELDDRVGATVVEVGPLSFGALRRLVADRTGDALPRHVVRRVHAVSGGNPFYALEVVRALRRLERPPALDEELPVPGPLDRILGARLRALPRSTRWALAAAAALAVPRVELVEGEGDLQPALDAGIVRVAGGAVRFDHPLLASTAYALLAPARRRALHARLARLVDDVEERARHLAAARAGPDETVAVALDVAASRALARGAPTVAGELLELAAARTSDPIRLASRRLGAVRAHFRAGDFAAARVVADRAVAESPPGPERARTLTLAAWVRRGELATAAVLADQAWAEAQGDRAAEALAASAVCYSNLFGGEPARAREYARHALDRVDALPEEELVSVVAVASFAELTTTGRVDERLFARALDAEDRLGGRSDGVEVRAVLGDKLVIEERYAEARVELEKLVEQLEAAGHEHRLLDTLGHLAQVETRAGRPAAGAAIAAKADEIDAVIGVPRRRALGGFFAAQAAAYLGRVDEVRSLTAAGLAAAAEVGDLPFAWQHAAILGFLELSLGNHAEAVRVLAPVAEALAVQVPEIPPTLVQVLPNLIESLIALGRLEDARPHLERLERRGRELDSAWALSQAARAHALIAAARGDAAEASARFEEALSEHERMESPFERGRTLLAQGVVLRRGRHWRAARESLEAALAIFEQVEARLWAERARAELARVGGRSASAGLTASEERVAHLAADGRSNKEIANELFVAVRTVEAHLTKVYAKLGVRSRTALSRRLGA